MSDPDGPEFKGTGLPRGEKNNYPQAEKVEKSTRSKNGKPEDLDLQGFRLFHSPCGKESHICGLFGDNSSESG